MLRLVAVFAMLATTVAVVPSPSGAANSIVTVFDDMEHGNPFANDWFSFNGGGGGDIAPNGDDVPPGGGSFSLESGWGGAPGFYGGFGRANPLDLTGTDHFNFWINPNPGQSYTLEINFQDDDNGDGAITAPDDDEFQFNCAISDVGPCAIAGGGWQLVSIPFTDLFDDGSFLFGGNGVFDPGPGGELINVVIAVIGDGGPAEFRTDNWTFTDGPRNFDTVVADFESGLPSGVDASGNALGYFTFQGAGSTIAISTTDVPPGPVPGADVGNSVLQSDMDVGSFAGFIHAFTNPAADTWVTQDWSTSEGVQFWLNGQGSGTSLFIDLLDNRNPGSTVDDAERWTVTFPDNFVGWQLFQFPFSLFTRKEIGNGAPSDGLTLVAMHGWAFGTLGTDSPQTWYLDDFGTYGIAEPPGLAVNLSTQNTFVTEGEVAQVGVKLNRPMTADDPAEVSIDYATERSLADPGTDFTPTSGTLTFVNGGATELFFPVETFDDTKFEGDEQIVIRLTKPVDVERGTLFQGSVLIDDDEAPDPLLLDDFTQGAYLWESTDGAAITADAVTIGDAGARPEQDPVEDIGVITVPIAVGIDGNAGAAATIDAALCRNGLPRTNGVAPIALLSTDTFDATTVDVDSVQLGAAGDTKGKKRIDDVNGDGLDDLNLLFRRSEVGATCDGEPTPLTGETDDGTAFAVTGSDAAITRDFPIGQDWSDIDSIDFWYHGAGTGEPVVVTLKDNQAPDPGPSGWTLAWADEFNEPAGTSPDPDNWGFELGDTTPDGKNGWGNEELQYYTDDPANVSTDGLGNLVITLTEADGSQECYYGPCEYESARLVTQNRAEFAYGRIESRLLVPDGGPGLWPAFWSLGTDITSNPWPGAGEIDFMEYVSRLPNEAFGTIHGPGYSGGASFGGILDFGEPTYSDYRTFTVEWEPDLITWYVDGVQYHQATPADVSGPWVFEKPFFLLLNFAIGGNFGGPVAEDNIYPQEYAIDYVRVYQAPDTAERFEATFVDDVPGWRQVSVPLSAFERGAEQPVGAPDDGLTLSDVWGYGLAFPEGNGTGEAAIDLVQLVEPPAPTEITVTSTADAGEGSLRDAIAEIAEGGTITLDPALAGSTITLTSGQLVADRSMTIDGSDAPGVVVSGGNTSRVLQVNGGATVTITDLAIADGVGAPQGGGVLNFGTLTLERVVVRDNVETGFGPDFQFGGGGIYNGDGATLNLTDSTVRDNASLSNPGGGVYGFFNSTINITRSTISGNVSGDVAGGLRSLGNATVVNSTFSGNVSTAWHGGGIFHTDGELTVEYSTFAENVAPAGTASGILVATFGNPANATLTNNILEGNGGAFACAIEGGGAATITSGGGNVISDGSCSPVGSDQSNTDALLGSLIDNGGPTLTHAPGVGSPAIDIADPGDCPATDQRGVSRPQGTACDAGAVEFD